MSKIKDIVQKIPSWRQLFKIVGQKGIVQNMPFILYCSLLSIIYITINHFAENTIRKINKTAVELKELRWRYTDEKSQIMRMTKESRLAEDVAILSLEKSKVPPNKIVITQKSQHESK
ncbi:MAG: FtsL-like putative cell division protein [Chitinophagaceae bacterium]